MKTKTTASKSVRNMEWVRLNVVDGLTHREIATHYAVAVPTVRSALALPASRSFAIRLISEMEQQAVSEAMRHIRVSMREKCRLCRRFAKRLGIRDEDEEVEDSFPASVDLHSDVKSYLAVDDQIMRQVASLQARRIALERDARAGEQWNEEKRQIDRLEQMEEVSTGLGGGTSSLLTLPNNQRAYH